MNTEPAAVGTQADWLADKALRGLIATVLKLPYEARVRMMGSTLRNAIGPLLGYRKRAEENLALIYPEMPNDERTAIAQGVCDNFGRTMIENYSYGEFARKLESTAPTGEGLAAVAEAKKLGQPVIFVTGHFGNHEAPRHILCREGYVVGGLYRKMTNPYFNAHYAKTMTSWGGPVFEQGRKGTMGFARHLKNGGMGTLLFDVNAAGGMPIPFLGKPAMTATSSAELALRLGAVVIPYFGTRRSDGINFNVEIEAPISATTIEDMMLQMTLRLEKRVEATPEQWFWIHRRWKSQPKP